MPLFFILGYALRDASQTFTPYNGTFDDPPLPVLPIYDTEGRSVANTFYTYTEHGLCHKLLPDVSFLTIYVIAPYPI